MICLPSPGRSCQKFAEGQLSGKREATILLSSRRDCDTEGQGLVAEGCGTGGAGVFVSPLCPPPGQRALSPAGRC